MSLQSVFKYIEHPFVSSGLMQVTPLHRGIIVTGAMATLLYVIKPKALFNDDGSAKTGPFGLDSQIPVGWLEASALVGAASGLFI